MDRFCGSGAFLAAGIRHGRRVIGVDESEIAIAVASQRPELVNKCRFLNYRIGSCDSALKWCLHFNAGALSAPGNEASAFRWEYLWRAERVYWLWLAARLHWRHGRIFRMMAVLTPVARSLGVSIPAAGDFISAYAPGVTLGSPLPLLLRSRP